MKEQEYYDIMKGWINKQMRDEDYIEMMCKNKDYRPDHHMLQGLKDINPKTFHKAVSFLKSAIRLIACGFGVFLRFDIAFFLLGVAEILGIIEEIKE